MTAATQGTEANGSGVSSVEFKLAWQKSEVTLVPRADALERYFFDGDQLMPGFSFPFDVTERLLFLPRKKHVPALFFEGRVQTVLDTEPCGEEGKPPLICLLDFMVRLHSLGARNVTVLRFGDVNPANVQAQYEERLRATVLV
jgi:hypothetical protein